jgi:hypothetical protein
MSLNMLSEFMQVLKSKRKPPTKTKYFPMHILFTTIYLLQEQKLDHRIYSEQEINMNSFIQATKHDVHMYEKFRDFTFYVCL